MRLPGGRLRAHIRRLRVQLPARAYEDVPELRIFWKNLVEGQNRASRKTEDYVDAFPQQRFTNYLTAIASHVLYLPRSPGLYSQALCLTCTYIKKSRPHKGRDQLFSNGYPAVPPKLSGATLRTTLRLCNGATPSGPTQALEVHGLTVPIVETAPFHSNPHLSAGCSRGEFSRPLAPDFHLAPALLWPERRDTTPIRSIYS